MPQAFQITEVEPKKVQINLGRMLAIANAYARQRLATDDEMYSKWIAGEIEYEELNKYFETRLAGGRDQDQVEAKKLTAQEKQQEIEDQFAYNQFLLGLKTFNDFEKYLKKREGAEAEGSPGFTAIQTYRAAAQEKVRQNEEVLWETQFNLGKVSYDQYADFLKQRSAVYDPSSDRGLSIAQKQETIEPQFRISELQRLYSSGYWGNRQADGTFDYLQNEIGFQNALKQEMGRYATGSPQRFSFEQAFANADANIRQFRFDQDKQSASLSRNNRYRDYVSAINDYNKVQSNVAAGRATPEQLAQAEQTLKTVEANYNAAQGYLDELLASPQNTTSKVPTAISATPQAPQIKTPSPTETPVPQPTKNQAPTPQPTQPINTTPNPVSTPAVFDLGSYLRQRPSPSNPNVQEFYNPQTNQGYANPQAVYQDFIGKRGDEYFNRKTNQGFASPDELFRFATSLGLGSVNNFNQLSFIK